MAKVVGLADVERHLTTRNGFYSYKRRVPAVIGILDPRYPIVRVALGTRDAGEARAKRDAHERADDLLWASLTEGGDQVAAEARYKSAVARAKALGYTYRHLPAILLEESGESILSRLRAVQDVKPASPQETAILGGVPRPPVSVWRALEIYIEEIVADEVSGKSPAQRELWENTKKRAVTSFVEVCGELNIDEITRDHARKFYNTWREKIAPNPKSGQSATHSPSSGNREIGNMRVLYQKYFEYMGVEDVTNPFRNLSFSEKKVGQKKKKKRPPFTAEWIVTRILKPGALAGLNDQARAISLILSETGCRPSEVANLVESQIFLDHPVPHIAIESRSDPEDPREIKTDASVRVIPLVGVALEALKKFPKGFPRYRDKESSMSAALNKYFRENGLFPTEKHVMYSFRHGFEDRMTVAGLDTELRMMLMGHTNARPEYGEGGTLEWKHAQLSKIALPFDPAIV